MANKFGERGTGGGEDPAAGRRSRQGAASPLGLGSGREFDLIRRFFADGPVQAREDVRVGPGDDAAVVAGDGIVLTSDLSVEDVHFRRSWLSPFEIGYRSAAATLSDLAAMAARPIGILVSLGLDDEEAEARGVGIMRGAEAAVSAAGGVVLGGDLTRSGGPIVVDVVGVGESRNPVLRSGASPGDEVWVTGELGGAALAVGALQRGETPDGAAFERFRAPRARVREARWFAERHLPRAMLDLSDGLGGDVEHIAQASGVAITLEPAAIPLHPSIAKAGTRPEAALALGLSGGEDYELCFVAAAGAVQRHRDAFLAEFGVPVTRVGTVEKGQGVFLLTPGGRESFDRGGFQHF
ncbi:MAG: thiamine-phosphate kinase [Gemmatimonadota bacterium]